jgi:hypothetical protein
MTATLPFVSINKTTRSRRSIDFALAPLDKLAARSSILIARRDAHFVSGEQSYDLPRYLFTGPGGGGDAPIRIGLFAGIHGDEPEGVHALIQFVLMLEQKPEWAAGYSLFIYPICNPTGFEDDTRHNRAGLDLNREFWTGSQQPEVALIESELTLHALHGIIALHTDDTSDGFYGFASGSTLTKNLIEPALAEVEQVLPRNQNQVIDNFPAKNGIIRQGYGYPGVLSGPPATRPRPFEIVLETPRTPSEYLKTAAFVIALHTILDRYREFMAFSPNI